MTTRGHRQSFSRVYENEQLPNTPDTIDMLVVMGGPHSPATTRQECPHFDSAAEQRLIRDCVEARKAVVGVCLGAQLIGQALGAPFEASPDKEIGKFPIRLTPQGLADPKFSHFGKELETGHWHNDMPGLTAGAVVIATSEGCPRQIIRYGELVYGFQCHMEFTSETMELLIAASQADLDSCAERRFVQQPDVIRAQDWLEGNEALFGFLDKLAAAYGWARENKLTTQPPGS